MADFTHCDSEFVEVGEDLDMTNFGAVKTLPLSPIKYVPPDITRELYMLEQYAQKGEKMVKVGTKVIFNGGKTIILWSDGTKTIATCGEGDSFDPYTGFCAAVVKRVFGSTGTAKRALKKANNVKEEDA